MIKLEILSKTHNFDYDFVTDLGGNFTYDECLLSAQSVVGCNVYEILPTCKSVIVVTIPYEKSLEKSNIASFSWGEDYHIRVNKILDSISSLFPNSVYTVDSNKVNERFFAAKSNIGYIGKNSMFISDKYGSYCYLGLVLIEEEIKSKRTSSIECGDCNKCIVACPVKAIGKQIDCNKCISERLQNRHNLNFEKLGSSIYGCDICQDVCPHNKKISKIDSFKYVDLEGNLFLSKKSYEELYRDCTFYWIGYRSFIRNVHLAYINKYNDYSKIEFLKNGNSEYLKKVYEKVMEGNENEE